VEYKWKPKSMIPVDADVAGNQLETIRQRNNDRLTPAAVVDDARPKSSPLHPAFEWRDKIAAKKYREDQARHMIRSIVVVPQIVDGGEQRDPIRAFVSVTRDEDTAYTSIVHAMSESELRDQIVQRAWRELLSWRQRYHEYEELASICRQIDKTAPKVEAA